MTDAWDPARYERFRDERRAPFWDLLAPVPLAPTMRVVDLGCGTGELSAELAARCPEGSVLGLDSSLAMLSQALPRAHARLRFERADFDDPAQHPALGEVDLLVSNAALQWSDDFERVFTALLRGLRAGAWLAVQVPRNFAQPSHTVAHALAKGEFAAKLGGVRERGTPSLERCATLLYAHGFESALCVEKVYGHVLPSTASVVEWVRGTLLTSYLPLLDEGEQARFLEAYRSALVKEVGEHSPYYFPFRRMLLVAQKR